jgi:hypothetical protein
VAHDAQTISANPFSVAVASAVIEIGGGHARYASPKVVVSALLEALWSLYSNTDAGYGAGGSVQVESSSPRA